MAIDDIDFLVVTSPESMCYLHGYSLRWYRAQSPLEWPPFVATVIHRDHDRLIHFDSFGEAAALRATSIVEDVRFYPERHWNPLAGADNDDLRFFRDELRSLKWPAKRFALELASPTPHPLFSQALQELLTSAGYEVVDGSAVLRDVRRRKSAQEISYIEEAARIADTGLLAVQQACVPGASELAVWGSLVAAMAEAGGEHGAMHECVVVGSIEEGHLCSSRRTMKTGDFVIADPAGVVNRYHANISRTFFVGDEPPPAAQRLLEIAGGGFDVLCEVATVGTPFTEVNRALRSYYADSGIWDLRAWVGGYEMGISFPPDWVGPLQFTVEDEEDERIIEDGMVTNFESIFHLPLLDTVVYQNSGTRCLSQLPRGLMVAPSDQSG